MVSDRQYFAGLVAVCIGLTAYRIWVIHLLGIDTYVDEAYYWGWSQHLDWGYYSKPPMIAALIALSESVFGHTLVALKLPALLSYPGTALVLFAIGRRYFSARAGFWSGVTFMTMPLVAALGLFVSTDAPLLFLWSLGLYALLRALDTASWRYWLLVGFCFGLGMMTKYTMAAFAGSAFLVMIFSPAGRRQLASLKPWTGFLVGVALFIPNIVWNADHGFPTFVHTAEITRLESRAFAPGEFLEFMGAQWASIGPLLGIALVMVLIRSSRLWGHEQSRALVLMTLPLIILVSVQALTGRANGNWAAPSFVGACVLVPAYFLMNDRKRLLAWAVSINVMLSVAIYHWPQIYALSGQTLTAKKDPYKRARGWAALAEQVRPYTNQYPDAAILATERESLAQLIYYLQPKRWAAWHPSHHVMDQYELTAPLTDDTPGPFLFVSEGSDISQIANRFSRTRYLGVAEVPVYPDLTRTRHLFLLEGFKGYK